MERFAVMGWSAGGAYAAACAAKIGDRVTAAALLSSSVPLDVYGTTKGLTAEDRVLLLLTRHAPWLASAVLKTSIVNASNTRLLRAAMRSFPPADRTVLTEWGPPDHALAFVREALRQGTEGCVQDYRIFGDPWGFALEEIVVPVQIWEGSDDRTGPPDYRTFLQRHIRNATVTVVEGEGHLSLLPHQAPAILTALLGGDHNAESDGSVERGVGEDHRAQRPEVNPACTANASSPSTSPPTGPIDVAPTSTSPRATSFTKPFAAMDPAARGRADGLLTAP